MQQTTHPPDIIAVNHYFFRMGLEIKHAEAFFLFYQSRHWQVTKGKMVRNWKALAFNWVCSFKKAKPVRGISIYRDP